VLSPDDVEAPMSIDRIDQMPATSEELDRESLEELMESYHRHPSNGPRSRVYDFGRLQVLVTDYADGRQTTALRSKRWDSWGPPREAVS
jgi:hypothetical protein